MDWALFSGLSPEHARSILRAARRRTFNRGEVVFHEGDPGDTLHLVALGHLAVRVTTPLGDTATLRILGPGEHFGELAVVSPAPRSATLVCLERSETLALHRDEIDHLRAEHPEIDRRLLETVIHEVRRMSEALLEVMYVPATVRLKRHLVTLAAQYPQDEMGRVVIPLTQDDLAGLCGTTRPTINQMLAKLVDQRLVRIGRGRIVVTDLPKLQRAAAR